MLTAVAASLMVLASSAQAGTSYLFEIEGVSAVPGKNYIPVTSTQPINLENSTLLVIQDGGSECENKWLPTGQVYTLISTTGGLSGTLGQEVEGREVEVPDGGEAELPLQGHDCERSPFGGFPFKEGEKREALQINYHETGSMQSVTATVVHGSPIPVSAVHVSGTPPVLVTNQPATVTAAIETSSGSPSGAVEFRRNPSVFSEEANPVCTNRPVIRHGSSFAATCRTSFAHSEVGAGGSPFLNLATAEFTPSPGENLLGSRGGTQKIQVAPGATTTAVQTSSKRPRVNTKVIYTAIVTPSYRGPNRPNGFVEFLDGGLPIGSCTAQQLVHDVFSSKATCETSYPAPGAHLITAVYTPAFPGRLTEDYEDFLGSVSQPRSVTVRPAKRH